MMQYDARWYAMQFFKKVLKTLARKVASTGSLGQARRAPAVLAQSGQACGCMRGSAAVAGNGCQKICPEGLRGRGTVDPRVYTLCEL